MAPVDAVIYPDELIALLRARRVIPFIGAGFSTALDLPDWDSLLQNIAADLEDDIPFDEVKRYCNNDYLQIAEYYLLKCDGTIGPIRHVVSRCLQNVKSPLQSGAHVELLNLGAPQIYTTNYDDLI